MNDWFNDPFFGGSGNPARDIQDHFDQVQRQMDNMMNSMFRGFGDFGFNDDFFNRPSLQDYSQRSQPHQSHRYSVDDAPQVEEVSDPSPYAAHTRSAPIVEEPDDDSDGEPQPSNQRTHQSSSRPTHAQPSRPQPYFYSSTMTSFTSSNGVQHAQKKTYDSSTGKTEMAELRRLGDQTVAKKREIDRDGHVSDMMDSRNVNEDEIQDFESRWHSTFNNPTAAIGHSGSNHHRGHHHRSLK